MTYLGIDVAKNNHVAAALSSQGEILLEPFAFANNCAGYEALAGKLETLADEPLVVGMESTAHYGENLVFYLTGKGYPVAVINPLKTASMRKSAIRVTKTDKVDSIIIAKSLMVDGYSLVQPFELKILKLRGLCKTRRNLTQMRTKSKIQMNAFVDQLFPELNQFFRSGLHINTAYALLKKHSRPSDIQGLHLTYLSNLLSKASRGRYGKQDAIHLRELAVSSVGIDSPVLSMQIALAIDQIELFTHQRDEIDETITQLMLELDSVIMTVPGIGYLNGAMILSGIGNIERFSHPGKLLAFAGLDPAVIQSGNFNARNTRMSKRGNTLLRYALINAAHNVVRNNDTFHLYYESKVQQGKSHYCALGHVAGKLVRVIFTLLTKNVSFDLP